jgi:hypothetical protein
MKLHGLSSELTVWPGTADVDKVDPAHHGADQALDMTTKMRLSHRSMRQRNAIFATAARQRDAVKVRTIVYQEVFRQSKHRPRHIGRHQEITTILG